MKFFLILFMFFCLTTAPVSFSLAQTNISPNCIEKVITQFESMHNVVSIKPNSYAKRVATYRCTVSFISVIDGKEELIIGSVDGNILKSDLCWEAMRKAKAEMYIYMLQKKQSPIPITCHE